MIIKIAVLVISTHNRRIAKRVCYPPLAPLRVHTGEEYDDQAGPSKPLMSVMEKKLIKVNFEIYIADRKATTMQYIGKAFSAPLC